MPFLNTVAKALVRSMGLMVRSSALTCDELRTELGAGPETARFMNGCKCPSSPILGDRHAS
jgi:hypothetical protein